MCGIAGFVCAREAVPDGERILRRFERDLFHRGPDDQGSVLTAEGRVGLTATRLSILDLSPAGHQPMWSVDRRHLIVFNGEIYNFTALRAALSAAGCTFRSRGDTEVVLELYRREGPSCLEKLRGMFAFAIWSVADETLFLARDPLGIKPLYYYADEQRGMLAFSSELKPLLRSRLVPRHLNPRAVDGYFRSGSVPEPATLIAAVSMLEAGSWMSWRRGKVVERRKYWALKFAEVESRKSNVEKRAAAEIVREALSDSVEHHFVSDVPVGLFLSGGIDSTALLATAKANGRENLMTFSVGSDDAAFDESDAAARTARHFQTDHHVLRLEEAAARRLFDEFLQRMDQPSVDGFNTYAVSQFAHSEGMKVVLSGLGGDELFGGYASFTQVPRMLATAKRAQLLGPLRRIAGTCVSRLATAPRWQRLGAFLAGPATLVAAYAAMRGIFTAAQAAQLARAACGESGEIEELELAPPTFRGTIADEISAMEISIYMRNQLLRDSDVMSMANKLELRVPLVDSAFVDRVTQIPAHQRIRRGKRLMLEAVPEIPEWVANAPKRGFRFPFEKWISDSWTEGTNLAERAGVRPSSWYQRWTIFVFERWARDVMCP